MTESEQIAAIESAIAALPPGLTAHEIALRVYAALEPTSDPYVEPFPAEPETLTLTAEQLEFIRVCKEQGSISVPHASADYATSKWLEAMNLVSAAAGGEDYTLWRLSRAGEEVLT